MAEGRLAWWAIGRLDVSRIAWLSWDVEAYVEENVCLESGRLERMESLCCAEKENVWIVFKACFHASSCLVAGRGSIAYATVDDVIASDKGSGLVLIVRLSLGCCRRAKISTPRHSDLG